jgi:hypothetical protein
VQGFFFNNQANFIDSIKWYQYIEKGNIYDKKRERKLGLQLMDTFSYKDEKVMT